MLAVFGFLTNREKAVVFWGVAFAIYAVVKGDGLASQLLVLVRSALVPKLFLVWATTAAYCGALIFVANRLHVWHVTATKESVYWFLGTALALVGAVLSAQSFDREFATRLMRRAIRFTLIVEFLVGVYVMPLIVELIFVPLVALLIGVQAVAERDPQFAQVRRLVDVVLAFAGVSLAVYVLVSAITDLEGLLTRERGETFLLAPSFTLALVPLLYVVARWSRWDRERIERRWRHRNVTFNDGAGASAGS